MSGDGPMSTGGPRIPRPELHAAGLVAIAGLILLGIGAIAGGAALVAAPDGSVMHFDPAILGGSPFRDFLVPGLILGGLFGIGSFVVAVAGFRRARPAPFCAFAIGCGQMVWIVVELAIIRELRLPAPDDVRAGSRDRGRVRALGLAHVPGLERDSPAHAGDPLR